MKSAVLEYDPEFNEDQIFAEVKFTREERERIHPDSVLKIDVMIE